MLQREGLRIKIAIMIETAIDRTMALLEYGFERFWVLVQATVVTKLETTKTSLLESEFPKT